MKKLIVLATITLMTVFAVTTIAFAWGGKNATGEITSFDSANKFYPTATVQGYTEGGRLWLGFSFKCGNGGWEDRKPKKVKGSFSESFNMTICGPGYSHLRTCLWEGKSGGLMQGRVACEDINY